MADFAEMASDYLNRLTKSTTPDLTATIISLEISLKGLTDPEKKALAAEVEAEVRRRRQKGYIIKEADNKAFLALVELIVSGKK